MARKAPILSREYNLEIDLEIFNEAYIRNDELYKIHRYEVYFGGSSAGKSVHIAMKLALQTTTLEGRNLVCLRKQGTDAKDSAYPEIYKALEKLGLLDFWNIVEHPVPRLTNRINGNVIAFTGLDSVENVKSVTFKKGNLTDLWYEEASEEPDVKNIRELDRRLRGKGVKKRMIVSFNPVSREHWLKEWIENEIANRDSFILKTTYRDNKFLDQEDIETLESYKYTDPWAYEVYANGNWGTMGQTIFDANTIYARLVELQQIHRQFPPACGEFSFKSISSGQVDTESFKFFEVNSGSITIYKMPESRKPYVISVDTAGEGMDYYAAHVFDNVTKEQVAVFHSREFPDYCVTQLYGLARMYNDALVCIEINFEMYSLKKLQEWGYTNLYRRMNPGDSIHDRTEPKYGFRTHSGNRTLILTNLRKWIQTNANKINDEKTLNELLMFTRQQKGIKQWWGAEPGSHDDLCFVAGTLILTNNGQVPIENIKVGDMVLTREGYKPVEITTSSYKRVITKLGLTGTSNHPIITTNGVKPLDIVSDSDVIYMWNESLSIIEEKKAWNAKQLFTTAKNTIDTQNQKGDTLEHIFGDMTNGKNRRLHYTGKYGLTTLEKYLKGMLSITRIKTHSIMTLIILNVFRLGNTVLTICLKKIGAKCLEKTEENNQKELKKTLQIGEGIILNLPKKHIEKTVRIKRTGLLNLLQNGAKKIQNLPTNLLKKMGKKVQIKDGGKTEKVYNLQVAETHEYFANNILVHNCMALAIALQAFEQQYSEVQPERGSINGFWTDLMLERAVMEGRIDKEVAREYIERRKQRESKNSSERKSRYAR